MFVPRVAQTEAGRRVPRPLRTRAGADVDAVYFKSQRALVQERERIHAAGGMTFEADLKVTSRFVMERFINGGLTLRGVARPGDGVLELMDPQVHAADVTPTLRTLSLDIETDGWDGPVLSIALAGCGVEQVFMARDGLLVTERGHAGGGLRADPHARPRRAARLERGGLRPARARRTMSGLGDSVRAGAARASAARVLVGDAQSVSIARVPGRVVLDGVATMRNASLGLRALHARPRRAAAARAREADQESPLPDPLPHAGEGDGGAGGGDSPDVPRRPGGARGLQPRGRAAGAGDLREGRVGRVHRGAREAHRAAARSPGRLGGGVRPSLPAAAAPSRLRRARRGHQRARSPSPGGHVLDSVPGLYTHVASFDFRSLYPSIIRTFQVDPLGLWQPGEHPVQGFDGAHFARSGAMLPGVDHPPARGAHEGARRGQRDALDGPSRS